MAKKTAVKPSARKGGRRPPAKKRARATRAKKTARRSTATAKKAVKRPARTAAKRSAAKKRTVSRTQQGRVALPGPAKNLALDELRDRVLIELAALAESDRAGARPYKMVLVVKRTRTGPLRYKLVVER